MTSMRTETVFTLLVAFSVTTKYGFASDPSKGSGSKKPGKSLLSPIAPPFVPKSFRTPVCQYSEIPPLNALYYQPVEAPIYEADNFPPHIEREKAEKFVVYAFEAHEKHPQSPEASFLRLPYTFLGKHSIDCKIDRESLPSFTSTDTWHGEYCVALRGLECEEIRLDIFVERVSDTEQRKFVNLRYRDPSNDVEYQVKTWIVGTHFEADGADITNYNYYEISDDAQLPLNAYKPLLSHLDFLPFEENNRNEKHAQLAINWLPSTCLSLWHRRKWLSKEQCKQSKWAIHGFWETLGKDPSSRVHPILNEDQYNVKGMREMWASVSREMTKEQFWSRQWFKHGLLLDFEHPREYFETTISLFNHSMIRTAVEGIQKLADDFEVHDIHSFKGRINAFFPKHVTMVCATNTLSKELVLFTTILVCYGKEGRYWKIEDCNRNIDNCQIRARNDLLIYPATFHTFPYITFTLFWLPTQVARMRLMTNEVGVSQTVDDRRSQEWKIHKLCSHGRYHNLRVNYGIDLNYLQIRTDWENEFGHILPRGLETEWPNLKEAAGRPNIDLWYSWYFDCGLFLRSMDIPQLRGTLRFFNHSLELKRKVNTEHWGLPKDAVLNTEDVRVQIKSKVGANVVLFCFSSPNRNVYLVKVRICFRSNREMTLFDCPVTAQTFKMKRQKKYFEIPNEVTDCGPKLIIPSAAPH